jgi:hypothetical protein
MRCLVSLFSAAALLSLGGCDSTILPPDSSDLVRSLEVARVALDSSTGFVSERDDCTACVIYPGTYLELYVRWTNTSNDWVTATLPDDCVDTDPVSGGSILVNDSTGQDATFACASPAEKTVDLAPYQQGGFWGDDFYNDQEVAWFYIPYADIEDGSAGFTWEDALTFRYADDSRAIHAIEGDFGDW